jgi:DNA-binding LacI/PurR family transcriptional regulator
MSLKAIAKELGLSVTTVSRALNGYDDVSVRRAPAWKRRLSAVVTDLTPSPGA